MNLSVSVNRNVKEEIFKPVAHPKFWFQYAGSFNSIATISVWLIPNNPYTISSVCFYLSRPSMNRVNILLFVYSSPDRIRIQYTVHSVGRLSLDFPQFGVFPFYIILVLRAILFFDLLALFKS